MKNLFRTTAIVFVLGFISTLSFAQDTTYTVKVTVKDVREITGFIAGTMTDNPEGFPQVENPVATAKVAVTGKGDVELVFENVKAGKYAVVLMHDVNGNGTLDMNGQMPAEPFGFSKITMFFGPPQFSEAAFEVTKDTETIISLISF